MCHPNKHGSNVSFIISSQYSRGHSLIPIKYQKHAIHSGFWCRILDEDEEEEVMMCMPCIVQV